MEPEKKVDLEKPIEVLTSSADLTQASQTYTNSSLGYLAEVESGGSQLSLSQDKTFLPSSSSYFDSDSFGILEDPKETPENEKSGSTQKKSSGSQLQDEQSVGGEATSKVKSFDDLLEFSDSDSF